MTTSEQLEDIRASMIDMLHRALMTEDPGKIDPGSVREMSQAIKLIYRSIEIHESLKESGW